MSAIDPTAVSHAHGHPEAHAHEDHGHSHAHPPHLAHHFDTPEQQFDASKLGMWAFLATEILMFGGLFCAYAVYRYNHPGVFRYGEHHVSTFWGALNTIILLTSSLTMAMGVRAAQLRQSKTLIAMLIATILGGAGFMVIKAIEYHDKWDHGLFPGVFNRYDRVMNNEQFAAAMLGHGEAEVHLEGEMHQDIETAPGVPHHTEGAGVGGEGAEFQQPGEATIESAAAPPDLTFLGPAYRDPNFGSPDAAKIRPRLEVEEGGIADAGIAGGHATLEYADLSLMEQAQVAKFFNIYFMMTGLHGLHVLVGIALITWILYRSVADNYRAMVLAGAVLLLALYLVFVGALTGGHVLLWIIVGLVGAGGIVWLLAALGRSRRLATTGGEFGPEYFTPVDLVGLYWHLVDLIWIFLFPLLYLIH